MADTVTAVTRPRTVDQLIVNVATINVSDEPVVEDDEQLFNTSDDDASEDAVFISGSVRLPALSSQDENEDSFEIVDADSEKYRPRGERAQRTERTVIKLEKSDSISGGKAIKEADSASKTSADGSPSTLAKSILARKESIQRRIHQIRIRGRTVWEIQLSDPSSPEGHVISTGLFIASDASFQHVVYKVDPLVSTAHLQLKPRDRLLEVNGLAVSGWAQGALSSLFLSLQLTATAGRLHTQHATIRGSLRRTANAWQPFSMVVERPSRPGSRPEQRATPMMRLLRARLSYQPTTRQALFSEVNARPVGHVALVFRRRRCVRLHHPDSRTWVAVTSLLDGRARFCVRDDEGDGTRFTLHEHSTVDAPSVAVCLLQTPSGLFVSCSGNSQPVLTGQATTVPFDEEPLQICDARCLFSHTTGTAAEGATVLETIKGGHLAEYLAVDRRSLQFTLGASPQQATFIIKDAPVSSPS